MHFETNLFFWQNAANFLRTADVIGTYMGFSRQGAGSMRIHDDSVVYCVHTKSVFTMGFIEPVALPAKPSSSFDF